MIKGVNKKVIEINRTDSAYFERAVLYLKPDVNEVPLHIAQLETLDYFNPAKKKKISKNWLLFLLGAVSSAVVCCLIVYFWQ